MRRNSQRFQAVEIDGEAPWDGGLGGRLSLLLLIAQSPADDLLLKQMDPHRRESVATTAHDILDRMNEVTLNTSLLKEWRSIALPKKWIEADGRPGHHDREPSFQRLEALREHRIDGGGPVTDLGNFSKTDARWSVLSRLDGLARQAADRSRQTHRGDLGRRYTIDFARELLE